MTAIYPGSFDPTTSGHVDIIKRAANIVETLVVAVLVNPQKKPLFSLEERMHHLKLIAKDIKGVKVASFDGLLVDFAKEYNAKLIIRGLRALTDFEYEFQMALTNRKLNPNIETVFIPTSLQHLFISSSVVKEVAALGGDFTGMIPQEIAEDLNSKFH